MDPFKRDKLVLIQTPDAPNALNEPSGEWVNLISAGDGKVWAQIRDMTGRQFVAATSTQNEVVSEIVILTREGVTAGARIVHGADIYEIKAVLRPDLRHLKLMCARGVSNG